MFYMMDACQHTDKDFFVLDCPNPAGHPIEVIYLKQSFESFVGATSCLIWHGLTIGKAALWYKASKNLNLVHNVIEMKGYCPDDTPHLWVAYIGEICWINPSPNMPKL